MSSQPAEPPQSSKGPSTVVIVLASVGGGLVLFALTVTLVVYANKRARAKAQGLLPLRRPVQATRTVPHGPSSNSPSLVETSFSNVELAQLGRVRGRVRECMTTMNIHTGEYGQDGRPVNRPVLWADIAGFQPPALVEAVEASMRTYLEQQGHVVIHPTYSVQGPTDLVVHGSAMIRPPTPYQPRAHEVIMQHGNPYGRSPSETSSFDSDLSSAGSSSAIQAPPGTPLAPSPEPSASDSSSSLSFGPHAQQVFGGYIPQRQLYEEDSSETEESEEDAVRPHNESASTLPRYCSPPPSYKSEDEPSSGWF